jgi:amidase
MRSNSRISVLGCPALSIPAGFSAAGLPVGLQLVARPFAERALLEVAHALELRTGSAERIPPLAR